MNIKNLLIGYHGTNLENSQKIIQKKRFYYSNSKTEWLGEGIYFYFREQDAQDWARKKYGEKGIVLCAYIRLDGGFIDLDTQHGKQIIEASKYKLVNEYNIKKSNIEENQCTLMNFIWNEYHNCKMIIGLFPLERSIFPTLSDGRTKRREFCIRDKRMIKSVVMLNRKKSKRYQV